MSDSAGASPVQLDDQNRIAEDLPCAACGYNLRTQATTAKCPECGASVQRTILVARLRFADPAWLRSISYSVFWLTIGLCVLLCAPLLGWLGDKPPILLVALVVAVPPVTLVLGLWQATRREPHRRAKFADALRGLSRWGLAGGLGLTLLYIACSPLIFDAHGANLPVWMITFITFTMSALLIVGTLSGLTVGLIIASRVRSRALIKAMGSYLVLALILSTPLMLLMLINLLSPLAWELEQWFARGGSDVPITDWLWVVTDSLVLLPIHWTGWALWGLGILFLPLMFWYRQRLRDAAGAAQRRVAGETQNTAPVSAVETYR